MSEQKMREAFEKLPVAFGWSLASFKAGWDAREALAQQPAAVVCQGKNCGSTNGRLHSTECYAEHEATIGCAAVVELTDDDVIRFAQTVKFKGRFVEAMREVLAFAKQGDAA